MTGKPADTGVTLERVLAVLGAVAIAAIVFVGSYRAMSRRGGERALPEPVAQLAEEELPEPASGPRIRQSMFRPPSSLDRPEVAPATAEPSVAAPARTPSVPILGGAPYFGYVPPVVTTLPLPAGTDGGGDAAPAPVVDAPEPAKGPPKPPDVSVVITATVRGKDGLKALVESKTTGESRWVAAGGEAFGYRVSRVTPRGGVVEKGDRAYVLPVGAGKPVPAPPAEPEAPGEAGKTATGTGDRAAEKPAPH